MTQGDQFIFFTIICKEHLQYVVSKTFSFPLHNRSLSLNIWVALLNLTGQLNRTLASPVALLFYQISVQSRDLRARQCWEPGKQTQVQCSRNLYSKGKGRPISGQLQHGVLWAKIGERPGYDESTQEGHLKPIFFPEKERKKQLIAPM